MSAKVAISQHHEIDLVDQIVVQRQIAPAAAWERQAELKIRKLLSDHLNSNSASTKPLMIAVVGIPGAGKSTCTNILQKYLEDMGCLVFPHDGYHYTIEDLKQFDNPADAIYRRGAPDTFDANWLRKDLNRIRNGGEGNIYLPGFEHDIGDPIAGVHEFRRNEHKVVICEGLYLLHDDDGWEDIASFFDYSLFVDGDVDNCMERLKKRNLCIPGYSPEDIVTRVDAVDRANALTVDKSRRRAQEIVRS